MNIGRIRFLSSEKCRRAFVQFMTNRGASNVKKKVYALGEFFDREENWATTELRPLYRPGRAWSEEELRLKSSQDLHKLWYVLLKERNMLLTMQEAYVVRAMTFPNPERTHRVKESMENIEKVVHERNDAYLKLETGESASPRMRTVTSFMGFTYQTQAEEHCEPAEVTSSKEYEVPYLDDEAYMMQRIWNEKKHMQAEVEEFLRYWKNLRTDDHIRFGRTLRKSYNQLGHMPKQVLAEIDAQN